MEKWIKDLIEQNTDEDGAFNVEGFTNAYDSEAPKQVVPKDVFNEKNDELKAAREAVSKLENTDDGEDLKEQVSRYKEKLEAIEKERTEEKLSLKIKESLGDAHDKEFVTGLLKDKVKLNDDGEVENLENVLKEAKEKQPYLFKSEEKATDEEGGDNEVNAEVNNNKLPNPQNKKLTRKDIAKIKDPSERIEALKQLSSK